VLSDPHLVALLSKPLDSILRPTGLDAAVFTDPDFNLEDILEQAKKIYSAYKRSAMISQAEAKGIYAITKELFDEIRNGPAKYLKFFDGKHGIVFRTPQLGPSGVRDVPCFFCGKLERASYIGDIGIHVTNCVPAMLLVPPPDSLFLLVKEPRRSASLLLDSTDDSLMEETLEWMRLWEWRKPRALKYFHKRFKKDESSDESSDSEEDDTPSLVVVDPAENWDLSDVELDNSISTPEPEVTVTEHPFNESVYQVKAPFHIPLAEPKSTVDYQSGLFWNRKKKKKANH
jgi:hypothetical protein